MCGIVGGNLFESIEQLKEATNLLVHRGRNNTGLFEDDGMFLGHTRLSIQDVATEANQPMSDSSGDLWITYNGELWDGWQELRRQLEDEYSFKTKNSDTELILYLYKKYGNDFIKKLDGMFSFTLYDKQKRLLYLGRDWVGKLPFYFIIRNGKIAFASEKKVLFKMFNCGIKDIQTVEPSHYYLFSLDLSSLRKNRFYSLPVNPIEGPPDELATEIRRLLDQGVKNRLISDVPVCTILSGGVDSLLTTYLLKKYIPNIEAFVVSVGETDGKDDLYHARLSADYLKIKLHEVILTKDYIQENLKDAIYATEEKRWTQVSPAVPQIALARAIDDAGFKVVMGGEGSDEIWGSYGDVFRWYYKDDDFQKKRFSLIEKLHARNLIRANQAMMWGGTVELRMPFLHRPLVEYGLNTPPKYKKIDGRMKPLLRLGFKDEIPDELLNRPKATFQVGAHSDFLKQQKDEIKEIYEKLFTKTTKSKFWE